MTRRISESGFTLLEVLVASMLLAMLITILTMVFNSSSIAWNTGKASVAEMEEVRLGMSVATLAADNAVPGVDVNNLDAWGYLVGPWDAQGNIRRRAVESTTLGGEPLTTKPNLGSGKGSWLYGSGGEKLWATSDSADIKNKAGNAKAYVVGVWSLGRDGKENTGDDITTWPDAD